MLVCWEWLSEYVRLNSTPEELALRFAMSGLNHESTEQVGSDVVLDLEVTSNRGDCLGHVGVAREAAVLQGESLQLPKASVATAERPASEDIQVENEFPEGCPEYTARIVRGVRVGPSPEWLVRRLAAVGVNSVNNVVDVTNYVMLELGQPLHAFDLRHVRGGKIVVRAASEKEKFLAIDHKTYELDPRMVVIADAEGAVALGGVMGGANSEVSNETTDLLIEAARFQPLAIRRTARKLKLHSPSSYRFERSPDPAGLEAAGLRCCQLIVELAGGELSSGIVRAGAKPPMRRSVGFRLGQIPRILGVDVPSNDVVRILTALGCEVSETRVGDDTARGVSGRETAAELKVVPPTWRADLSREIDLIEEVARIHGYDQIPENVPVPIGVATPRPKDLALQQARRALSGYGIDEAMTPSVVSANLEEVASFWSTREPLATDTPLLAGAKKLRRSLVPSLLVARHANQIQSLPNAQLYEVANVYLPREGQGEQQGDLPHEQCTLAIVTEGDLRLIKGIVEEVLQQVAGLNSQFEWRALEHPVCETNSGQTILHRDQVIGFAGLLNSKTQAAFSLAAPVGVAELNVDALVDLLEPVRRAGPVSAFPAITRDLNFVVSESMQWKSMSECCSSCGGGLLQSVEFQEIYRDPKKDGADRKRILLTLHFQSFERTLTGDEVDIAVQKIVAACQEQLHAQLLG